VNLNAIPRRNIYLNDAIEHLDQYFIRANRSAKKAWSMLSQRETDFCEEEIERCLTDACYYLENYHVIQPIEGKMQTLMFMDSQQMIYDTVLKIQKQKRPVKIVCAKARQVGSSTLSEGLIFHKTIFTRGCNTLIVAQDPATAGALFEMSRLAYDRLPWWMRPEARYDAKGKYMVFDKRDDMERQFRPGMRSQIVVESSNKLTQAGRGKTFLAVHLSELSSWPDGGLLSKSLFPTMHADDELAFMESTALGRQGFWYEWWRGVESGEITDWTPVFIPYYTIKKYSKPIPAGVEFKLTEEEKHVREKVQEDDDFIIADETFNWVRMKKAEFIRLEGDEFSFYGEYPSNPTEMFQTSGMCAFPKKLLQKVLETTCCKPRWYGEIYYKSTSHKDVFNFYDPVEQKMGQLHCTGFFDSQGRFHYTKGERIPPAKEESARFRVWEEPDSAAEYYMAVDVAMGEEGGDFSAIEVLRLGRGQNPDVQVAEWHGWINPTDLATVAAAIGYWYNNAEIAIEVNSEGAVTNNHIFRVLEYDPLYRWKYIDKISNFITPYFGWYTNSKTRPLIIVKGREALMERTVILRSESLVDEMMAFTREEGEEKFMGRGTHDDLVMSFLICRYCAHEFDYADQTSSKSRASVATNETFYIFDDQNRLRFTSDDRERAEMYVRTHPGWAMRGEPQKRDYANTDFSPIHDREKGPHRELYEQGVAPERIPVDVAMYSDFNRGLAKGEVDDWRAW
jgi:hypothetical protein